MASLRNAMAQAPVGQRKDAASSGPRCDNAPAMSSARCKSQRKEGLRRNSPANPHMRYYSYCQSALVKWFLKVSFAGSLRSAWNSSSGTQRHSPLANSTVLPLALKRWENSQSLSVVVLMPRSTEGTDR